MERNYKAFTSIHFHESIRFCQTYYKQYHHFLNDKLIFQIKFNKLVKKNFIKSRFFIDNIWNKLKDDFSYQQKET